MAYITCVAMIIISYLAFVAFVACFSYCGWVFLNTKYIKCIPLSLVYQALWLLCPSKTMASHKARDANELGASPPSNSNS